MDVLVAFAGLILVLDDVLDLELPHALNFIEIYHKTFIVSVVGLDALSTEHSQVIGAVEVLHSFIMNLAHLVRERLFVFIFEVEVDFRKNGVLGDDLIENVNVQWKSLCTLKLFDQLSADWASDTILVVQLLDATRAQSVPTVDKDARDSLSNVVLETTKCAYVQTTRLIVQIDQLTSTLAIHLPLLYLRLYNQRDLPTL